MCGSLTTPASTAPLITTMLILQSDGRMTRPFAEYRAHFDNLTATGLPIILYLDRSLTSEGFPSNVTVIPTSIQDLSLWQETRGLDLRIPVSRKEIKDTADYLVIINSKTALIRRTVELHLPFTQHAFVDFGLFHIISDIHSTQERMRSITLHPADELVIPGIQTEPGDDLDRINWRFCGGFFYGSTAAMLAFARANEHALRDLLPRISWDVNIWAWMEVHRNFRPHWYKADHDDSILNIPGFESTR